MLHSDLQKFAPCGRIFLRMLPPNCRQPFRSAPPLRSDKPLIPPLRLLTVIAEARVAVINEVSAIPPSIHVTATSRPVMPTGALFSQPPLMSVEMAHQMDSMMPCRYPDGKESGLIRRSTIHSMFETSNTAIKITETTFSIWLENNAPNAPSPPFPLESATTITCRPDSKNGWLKSRRLSRSAVMLIAPIPTLYH